jgi:serine/threonine protein kinase
VFRARLKTGPCFEFGLHMPVSGLDVRADIYALGASLYFILTGSFPIDLASEDEAEQLRCVLHGDRIPVRRRVRELPARLAGVVDKACRKEPEWRFQTAEDFQRALAEVH